MPQQALALASSELALTQARVLARTLWRQVRNEGESSGGSPGGATRETGFVRAAFEQVLNRSPASKERSITEAFLLRQTKLFANTPAAPEEIEENRGENEKNRQEELPPSADPAMRTRESFVHALLNHNDFVTVR